MIYHWFRIGILLTVLLLIIQLNSAMDESEGLNNGDITLSSNESEEGLSERENRKRRSNNGNLNNSKLPEEILKNARFGLPGITGDIEALIKIAEILTTLGQQIIPNIISGNTTKYLKQRIAHDRLMLQTIKNEVAELTKDMNLKVKQ